MRRSWAVTVVLSIAVVLDLLVVAGCADRKRIVATEQPGDTWHLGPETTYVIDSQAAIGVADSITGEQFLFPEGGRGALHVSRILSGPAAPLPGEGFAVSFDEEVPLLLVVASSGRGPITVLGHGTAPGAYDDTPGPSARWTAVPLVDSLENGPAFQLNLPFGAAGPAVGGIEGAGGKRVAARRGTATAGGFSHYWISSIPAGSDEATRRMHLQLQAATYIDGVLGRLSPARRAAAQAEVGGRLRANYAWDGFFYTGFWWRSLGSHGRIVRPTIHLTTAANEGNIAHETGHYLTHVLVGDETWSTLEGQAPLWDTGHGIRDEIGRDVLLEDFAYFIEWLVIGTVKSYDLQDPYPIFSGLSPLTEDVPGLEGFAAVMLAALTRTAPTMRDVVGGRLVDVPVIGLSEAEVFDIIAGGPLGVEALRERIALAVGSQADKLPALLQRSGWRHSVRGRLVDENGTAIPGATVSSVSVVGERVYRGGSSSVPSDLQGRFQIPGGVFPGDSRIRVWTGRDSVDVAVSIPWTSRTDQTVDLGDLRVARSVDLAPLRYCTIDLFTQATYESDGGAYTSYRRIQIEAVRGAFAAGRFTGSRDTTDADGIHITIDLAATVDPVSGEVKTLDVTQVRAKASEWAETLVLSLANVEMLSYSTNGPRILMECQVGNEATCGSILHYSFTGQYENSELRQTAYSCAPDHENGYLSSLDVYFHNQPRF